MLEFTLRTTASPLSGRWLAKAAMSILSETIADEERLHEFDLVLSEGCANVVRHAYSEDSPGIMEITLKIEPGDSVEISISDWGHGLDPDKLNISAPPPEAEGGRGLFIMTKLSDDVHVEQDDSGKNSISCRKVMDKSAWKTST